MKLYLLRHGLTEGNLRHCYYGCTDLPVCPEGLEALKGLPAPKAEQYFTSGMLRTEQTFAALYGDLPHGTLPDLRETAFGKFEMKTYEELKDDPDYQRWITGEVEKNPIPGGESGVEALARALRGIAPVLASQKDTVVVTHGGVIGGLLMHWFGLSHRFAAAPQPGCGVVVEFDGECPIKWDFL